jgi:L-carnitine CoA-transferase
MTEAREVPDFGPLSGVRVVYSGIAIAGPWASTVLAELGADVLWLENAIAPEYTRDLRPLLIEQERRNQRNLALNIPTPAGREIFLKLLSKADVFIENSKGGQFSAWGLTDEVLWGANPALVIAHISGYGQSGDEAYIGRPATDPIAQSFGCYLQLQGDPDVPPTPARPFTADYLTALYASTAVLAALHRSRATGEGESIDVAMFEVLLRAGGVPPLAYLNEGTQPTRRSSQRTHTPGSGVIRCGDGRDVYVLLRGAGVLRRALPLFGLEYGSQEYPEGSYIVEFDTPAGDELERRVHAFCREHPAHEVARIFGEHGILCSMSYTYEDAVNDPHYQARQVFTSWSSVDGREIRGVKVIPEMKNRPGRIWAGAPRFGMDTEAVLTDLGYSAEEITRLCDTKIIAR